MNTLDPKAVIVKDVAVPSEIPDDDADFHTGPIDIDPVILEASLRVRAIGFYQNAGPRRHSKPVPARTVLSQPEIPRIRMYRSDSWRNIAITATVLAGASAASVWAILAVQW